MHTDPNSSNEVSASCSAQYPESNAALSSLRNLLADDTMNPEGLEDILKAALEEAAMKKKEILSAYRIRETARGWYIRDKRIDNGKKHEFKSRKDLEDYILKWERGEQQKAIVTIEKVYDAFVAWRKTTSAAETLAKDKRYYRDYFQKSSIVQADVTRLTKLDALEFFRFCLSLKPGMTKRYWAQIRATGSAIFEYLQEAGLVNGNIFEGLRIHSDNFAPTRYTPEEETVFSDDEAKAVKKEALKDIKASDDPVPYAILLTFALGMRVGEVCGLQWRDLETKNGKPVLHIQRQLVRDGNNGYKLVPHAKTNAGDRYLALNQYCLDIFKRIRSLNSQHGICVTKQDELIFQRLWHGKTTYCTVRVFDNKLVYYCSRAGMAVKKSMHDIRRTCLTTMYENGIRLKQLQYFAGHSTPQQTLDYIRRKDGVEIDEWLIDDSELLNETPTASNIIPLRASGDNGDRF